MTSKTIKAAKPVATAQVIKPIKLITDAALIGKAIASIAGRGHKLDSDVQTAGVSVLAHIAQHRDSTMADRLVDALPKGSRKLALVEWLLAFGNIRKLDKANADDAARIKSGHYFRMDDSKTFNQAGAEAKPWHSFKPEASPLTAFDVQAAVKGVLSRLEAASRGGLSITHRAEAITEAKALLASLETADKPVEEALM